MVGALPQIADLVTILVPLRLPLTTAALLMAAGSKGNTVYCTLRSLLLDVLSGPPSGVLFDRSILCVVQRYCVVCGIVVALAVCALVGNTALRSPYAIYPLFHCLSNNRIIGRPCQGIDRIQSKIGAFSSLPGHALPRHFMEYTPSLAISWNTRPPSPFHTKRNLIMHEQRERQSRYSLCRVGRLN